MKNWIAFVALVAYIGSAPLSARAAEGKMDSMSGKMGGKMTHHSMPMKRRMGRMHHMSRMHHGMMKGHMMNGHMMKGHMMNGHMMNGHMMNGHMMNGHMMKKSGKM